MMDAKYVFNSIHRVWAGTLFKMADLAMAEGYEFFLFNDRVYHVFPMSGENYISETKLLKSDIFVYL